MITLSNVPVKVSQGGYVHLILSANISGSPGTLLGGVSKLHCWLQRKPSSGSTWTDIHNWLMYSNGTIQYDDDGVLESTGHNIAVSATTQFIDTPGRSEEHTSELQSLMRISYAVFCLKKKNTVINQYSQTTTHN